MSALPNDAFRPSLSVAVVGQIDSGKSTVVGHLRYQCGCVAQREMDKLAEQSAEMGKASFKFAWLSDKRQTERERGITIEVTETQLLTAKYALEILDTPGHKQFMKHAITGSAVADHLVLVVDAQEGAYEAGMTDDGATKEHALVAFAMGLTQIIVVVNKMDALATPYAKERFDQITTEVGEHLAKLGFREENIQYVPVAGWDGENLVTKSTRMPWYDGVTLLEAFDHMTPPPRPVDKPLRMTVSGSYKIGGVGLVVTGRVQSGVLKVGMEVSFGPTGAKGRVFSIESHHRQVSEASAGMGVGVNIKGDLTKNDVKRGDVMSDANCDEARPATAFTAQLVFFKHAATQKVNAGYTPVVHCHTTQVTSEIHEITALLDRQTGAVMARPSGDQQLTATGGDACTVVLHPTKPMVVEAFREYPQLGRIVVRDAASTIAVGIVRAVEKKGAWKP